MANWIKQYSQVKIDDETIVTAEQIKALQKRNAQLEEENQILKKAIAIFTPHFKKSVTEIEGKCENILKQNFNQPKPNLVWVSDFTYIKATNRNYYLCAIMDLFSKKIIAYKLSSRIDTKLAIDTLSLAISNRGSQFTSKVFRTHLDNLGIIQSFSAKGHPYHNAVMECFFKYLKKEETDRRHFSSIGDLDLTLFKYINGFYNSIRPHSHNNGLSPVQFENNFFNFL